MITRSPYHPNMNFKRDRHYIRSAIRYFQHQHPNCWQSSEFLQPLLKKFSQCFRIRILCNKFNRLRILRKKSCGSPGIILQPLGKNSATLRKNSALLRKNSALLRKNSALLSLTCFAQQT